MEAYAGSGSIGQSFEGGVTSIKFNAPSAIFMTTNGTLYIADSFNNQICIVVEDMMNVVDGVGLLGLPTGVWVDDVDNICIAENEDAVISMYFDSDGIFSTIAGNGNTESYGTVSGPFPATEMAISGPRNVVGDINGNIYVTDFNGNYVWRIFDGDAQVVIGDGEIININGVSALATSLNGPYGITIPSQSQSIVCVTEYNGHRIRCSSNRNLYDVNHTPAYLFTIAGTSHMT